MRTCGLLILCLGTFLPRADAAVLERREAPPAHEVNLAEEEKPKPKHEAEPKPKPKPETETVPVQDEPQRDPTVPSEKLERALRPAKVLAEKQIRLPSIAVKGIVKGQDRPAEALLEVAGAGMKSVRAGSRLQLAAGQGDEAAHLTYEVLSVASEEVLVEIKETGQRFSLR